MKVFVKKFSTTLLARMVVFGMQGNDDLLYLGIENQASSAYSSLYLSNCLFFYTLRVKFFVKDHHSS